MRVAARALIIDQEEIFLVRHRGTDFWAVPGGGSDPGENLAETLVREMREEFSLAAEPGIPRFAQEYFDPKRGHTGDFCLEFFSTLKNPEIFRGSVRPLEAEIEAAGWFPLGELPEILPAFLRAELANFDPTATDLKFFSRPRGE